MKKPNIAEKSPEMVKIEGGQNYAWCACGQSSRKTFCDGSHRGSEFSPKLFKVEEDKTVAICRCKHTSNPPYCDGTHNQL